MPIGPRITKEAATAENVLLFGLFCCGFQYARTNIESIMAKRMGLGETPGRKGVSPNPITNNGLNRYAGYIQCFWMLLALQTGFVCGSDLVVGIQIIIANRPPRIISGPSANPNPANTDNPVVFDVAAVDPDGDPLTYNWTFDDGTSGTGMAPVHQFVTGGTFEVVVNVADGRGGARSAVIEVLVVEKPSGGGAALPPWTVTGGKIGLNFRLPDRDKIQISGLLEVAQDFVQAGKKVDVDVGGAFASFTLDKRGRAKNGLNRMSIQFSKSKKSPPGTAKIMFLLRGTLQSALVDEGFINTTTPKTGTPLPLSTGISIDNSSYLTTITAKWKAVEGASGQGVVPRVKIP